MTTRIIRITECATNRHEIFFFNVPESSGELFAAYRAIAEVTKGELERLNSEFQGGAA